MSEPKRYMSDVCNLGPKGYSCLLIQHKEGEFVRYEDYARLKAEVERLSALVESNLNKSKLAMAKSDASVRTLEAQVERLTLENSQYEEHHKYGQNVITSLRDEVNRLTKAGDAFEEEFGYLTESLRMLDNERVILKQVLADWNAAKEGKGQP